MVQDTLEPTAVEENHFDAREPFIVEILSGTTRTCTVRYPSDKEWIERQNKLRIVRRDLGRGKSQTDRIRTEQIDEPLFRKILTSDAPDFDEYEAAMVIEVLMRADVDLAGVEKLGETTKIPMTVFGNREVLFEFRNPRRRAIVEYNNAVVSVVNEKRGQEVRVFMGPSAELFDAHLIAAEGYAPGSPIPIVHKDAAVYQLTQLLSPEA